MLASHSALRPPPMQQLINQVSRTYNFGKLIGQAGTTREHIYRLENHSSRTVRIVEVVNLKPCCGSVSVSANALAPNGSAEVRVTLRPHVPFGRVTHEAVVQTDPPAPEELRLVSQAEVYPPLRIEEPADGERAPLLSSTSPRKYLFTAFAYGTALDAPLDLNSLELRSTLKGEWCGPKSSESTDGELREDSRSFFVWLDAAGEPGARRGEVCLLRGGEVALRHELFWEVLARITTSPSVAVVDPAGGECRIEVRSHDHTAFRVVNASCDVPGVRARPFEPGAGLARSVRIESRPHSREAKGTLTLETDHPVQSKIRVPVVLLGSGDSPP